MREGDRTVEITDGTAQAEGAARGGPPMNLRSAWGAAPYNGTPDYGDHLGRAVEGSARIELFLEPDEEVLVARDGQEPAVDRSETWSSLEVLRDKDFEQMSLAEQSEARALMQREVAPLAPRPTRRFRPDPVGHRYDLRRSMRLAARNGGQLLTLVRKRRRLRPPPVVLICDISGSMSAYSRLFLYFAHALAAVNPRVHVFVFATRLTNVTRALAGRDADRALAAAGAPTTMSSIPSPVSQRSCRE